MNKGKNLPRVLNPKEICSAVIILRLALTTDDLEALKLAKVAYTDSRK